MNQTETSTGPLIGTIIVFIILVVGGIYLLQSRTAQSTPAATATGTQQTSVDQQPPADSLDSIQTAHGKIDVNNMDQGSADVDNSLQ